MPFTPYHFGVHGLLGLALRRWVDVPVLVAANVLIDVEVLADGYFAPGWPVHQLWHFHTLLVGGLAGAGFGAVVYYVRPLRWCSEKSMALAGLEGRATLLSMVLGGLLGALLHVAVDSVYHYDVQIFWPYARNPVIGWVRRLTGARYTDIQEAVRAVCVVFWGLMVVFYGWLLAGRFRKKGFRARE